MSYSNSLVFIGQSNRCIRMSGRFSSTYALKRLASTDLLVVGVPRICMTLTR